MMDYGTVGKYRLLRPLAQGGMAEIFLARQEGTAGFSKTVVVKRVLGHLSQHGEFIEMFLDEARLAAQLSHPNVVHIFDFGEADGSYYLAMEYLAGEDVSSILRAVRAKGQVIPSQIAALIASHTCEGLHYAHTLQDLAGAPLGIVHRDVSPSNIMVTFQGAVKILDFGIAKAAGKVVQTEAGKVKGKFMYMSPEQARGSHIDGRSDLFALGAVLYEMVSGVRLFQRENQLATLMAVTEEPIRPPREIRPHVPEELEQIILKALDRDPDNRYENALAMREALDDFLAMRTYAPSHVQLKQFLLDLFGEEHVAERARPLGQASLTPPSGSHKVPKSTNGAAAPAKPATHATPPPVPAAAIAASGGEAPVAAPASAGALDGATVSAPSAVAPAPAPAAEPVSAEALLDQETRIGEGLGGGAVPAPQVPVDLEEVSDEATRIRSVSEIRPQAPAPPPGEDTFFEDDDAPLVVPGKGSKKGLLFGGLAVVGIAVVAVVMLGHGKSTQKNALQPISGLHAAPTTGVGGGPAAKTGSAKTPAGTGETAAKTPAGTGETAAKTPAGTGETAAKTPAGTGETAAKTPAATPPTGKHTPKHETTPVIAKHTAHVHHPHHRIDRHRHGHKKPPPKKVVTTPAVPQTGILAVNCIPYCKIYIDGKDSHLTSPARHIKLSVGKHSLKLVNPPTHLERYHDVEIKPGKPTIAVIKF